MAEAKPVWPQLLRSQIALVSKRLNEFQSDADRLAAQLSARGQRSIREIQKLLEKVEKGPWADRSAEFAGRAKGLGNELAGHLEELQTKLIAVAGVATSEEVRDLAGEIQRLSKKVDGLSKSAVAAVKKTARAKAR